jgi:serine protease Do
MMLRELNDDLASLVANARRSLVQVASGPGNGAGTIWHSDGLIVTNAHVVAHGPLKVTLSDSRNFPAKVLASDDSLDLAALYIEANNLPTIAPSNSKGLRVGQWVIALGHPWGVIGGSTAGIVIGTGDEFPEMPANGREWIVVSLHLRPGHSGGPLLDSEGRLIGINTLITGPDVGFAIPAHIVKHFLRQRLGTPEHEPHAMTV